VCRCVPWPLRTDGETGANYELHPVGSTAFLTLNLSPLVVRIGDPLTLMPGHAGHFVFSAFPSMTSIKRKKTSRFARNGLRSFTLMERSRLTSRSASDCGVCDITTSPCSVDVSDVDASPYPSLRFNPRRLPLEVLTTRLLSEDTEFFRTVGFMIAGSFAVKGGYKVETILTGRQAFAGSYLPSFAFFGFSRIRWSPSMRAISSSPSWKGKRSSPTRSDGR